MSHRTHPGGGTNICFSNYCSCACAAASQKNEQRDVFRTTKQMESNHCCCFLQAEFSDLINEMLKHPVTVFCPLLHCCKPLQVLNFSLWNKKEKKCVLWDNLYPDLFLVHVDAVGLWSKKTSISNNISNTSSRLFQAPISFINVEETEQADTPFSMSGVWNRISHVSRLASALQRNPEIWCD